MWLFQLFQEIGEWHKKKQELENVWIQKDELN